METIIFASHKLSVANDVNIYIQRMFETPINGEPNYEVIAWDEQGDFWITKEAHTIEEAKTKANKLLNKIIKDYV